MGSLSEEMPYGAVPRVEFKNSDPEEAGLPGACPEAAPSAEGWPLARGGPDASLQPGPFPPWNSLLNFPLDGRFHNNNTEPFADFCFVVTNG